MNSFHETTPYMTDASITTICSAAGLGITFLVTEYFKYRRELMIREQNRKDVIADREAANKVILEAGGEREERFNNKIDQVRTVAIAGVRNAQKAYKEANGINIKLATEGVKLITETTIEPHETEHN